MKKWVWLFTLWMSFSAMAFQQGDKLTETASAGLKLDNSQLTIVDFFAEWCVSCRHELPLVNQLYRDLKQTGVTVVGVDVDEEVEVGLAFQQSLGLQFPVVNDPEQALIAEFQPIGMPALYYIYQGEVLKVRFGAINDIRNVILQDLAEMGLQL
ncbi:TlpA family protein disulfide reductase [Vibrio ostreicida]|uniref:TlpA disulfide reductase family protein n=1 Tax=Vibrio ostreicida TaxID=526588 RepID=A0ABT8C0Y3_9VIBR|nr:TlpA disulfide reductase family protein [Vibrio ostreicida]MDN3612289.1 TlpA disulfide reductase family protein [Vibrio ostreicida]